MHSQSQFSTFVPSVPSVFNLTFQSRSSFIEQGRQLSGIGNAALSEVFAASAPAAGRCDQFTQQSSHVNTQIGRSGENDCWRRAGSG